ncbi:hypothetical protein [Paraflavitalea pollutisoli]|uniref:hypothetical protein n=1 Tax=Paraflavitalea pollutisoli TaxID=3034143 RepID=UPI0023EC8138|nr:hypothetical protein [Paraflavitalea sp. H1-2-19X]
MKKDGTGYWRKNNTNRPLNAAMQASAAHTAVTNEAAKRVAARLLPVTSCLNTGSLITKMAGAFKKSLLQYGEMNYDHLRKLDFQPDDYTFSKLAKGHLQEHIENGRLHLSITVGGKSVTKHSKLPTGYWVELILLWGDPGSDKELRVDSITSDTYRFDEGKGAYTNCLLAIDLPERQAWMAMVKVTCSGNDVESSPKYNAMKVLRVGHGYTMLK